MAIIINSLLLLPLFAILGIAANLAVKNIRYIAVALKMRLFIFGILLGIVTTLPELAMGINALVDQAAGLSVGNLLGGVIVIFCLVLGISIFFNRKIVTDGRLTPMVLAAMFIFSSALFGIDGKYGLWDGVLIVGLYVGIVFYLYRQNYQNDVGGFLQIGLINKSKITQAVLLSGAGVIGILIASHWIVEASLSIFYHTGISRLVIGLVLAIGTNLPEISIALTSWRKKASELSLSHILSSALANILILGILATIHPMVFNLNPVYWVIVIFLGIALTLFVLFQRSEKKLDRREGLVLLLVYVLFIIISVYFGLSGI